MPQPKVYQDAAARQRAYRARRAAQPSPLAARAPGYPKWRKSIQQAYDLLNDTLDEMHSWMEDRSGRWHESDRASDIQEDLSQLAESLYALDDLHIRQGA